MTVEQQLETGTPTDQLVIRPSTQLLTLLRTPTAVADSSSSTAVALKTASLISENPGVAVQIIQAAHRYPDLFASQQELVLRSDLTTIRQLYPSVIGFFPDSSIQPLIAGYQPAERIQGIQDFVRDLPGGQTAQTIEVVLSILIEDGLSRDPKDYPAICASHQLFGRLSEAIYETEYLHPIEDKHFMQIGMRLLNTRRAFEINLEAAAAAFGESRVSRVADFNGTVAQSRAVGKMIRNLQIAEGALTNPFTRQQTQELLKWLRATLRLIDDELRIHHPDRYPGLQDLFALEGGEDLRRWAEHPGEPQFSPSELRDSDRSSR